METDAVTGLGGAEGEPAGTPFAEVLAALGLAERVLASIEGELWRAGSGELSRAMGAVDRVASLASAARVVITTEALSRGELQGRPAMRSWVLENAPSTSQGEVGGIVTMARRAAAATGAVEGAESVGNMRDDVGDDNPFGLVWQAVKSGRLTAALGCVALAELRRLAPQVRPEALPAVATGLVSAGMQRGSSFMRDLRAALLSTHGLDEDFEALHDQLASAASLSCPIVGSGALTEYRLFMTPEQAAVLEAAIGRLSAPRPNPETGERDHRPAGQRRVEALTQVCRRAAAVHPPRATRTATSGRDTTVENVRGPSCAVQVSITLAELQQMTGAGRVRVSRASGTMLSPGSVRRMACDAEVIPVVLGTRSEVLDIGVPARLFPRGHRRLMWERDRHCTYPGCDAPPAWCEAHHIIHWLDGGPTRPDNGALLCSHPPPRGPPPPVGGTSSRPAGRRRAQCHLGPRPRVVRPRSRCSAVVAGAGLMRRRAAIGEDAKHWGRRWILSRCRPTARFKTPMETR